MAKRTLQWWLLAVLVFLLIGLAALGSFLGVRWLRAIPPLPQQVKGLSTVQVFITSPANHSSWPADAAIPIKVSLQSSSPLAQLSLYVDGLEVANQAASGSGSQPFYFKWQPGKSGTISLMAQVMLSDNSTVNSDLVVLNISEPVGAVVEIPVLENESLEEIAERNSVEPQVIIDANPHLDFTQPLAPGTLIRIPVKIPIVPVVTQTPHPQQSGPIIDATIEKSGLWQDLSYYLGVQNESTSLPPLAPVIQANVDGCDVHLIISDIADNEDGFIVYRADNVATTFIQIATLEAHTGSQSLAFIDPGQSGNVTYSVSAYNTIGENQSQPVQVTLDAMSCLSAELLLQTDNGAKYKIEVIDGGLSVIGHTIKFAQPVNLAYLYVSINGKDWERIPEGNLKFLPGTGDQFNLDNYLDDLIEKIPDTHMEVRMQFWGWNGGSLVECGNVKVTVDRTVLRICGLPNIDCGEDLLRTEVYIPGMLYAPDLRYTFVWDTANRDQVGGMYFQIATHPFTGDEIGQVNGLIHSGGNFDQNGNIHFGFNYLYNDKPFSYGQWKSGTMLYDSNFFQDVYPYPDSPFTLYSRVVVYDKHGKRMQTSNTAIIHYQTSKEAEPEGVYASDYPSLYNVRLLPESYVSPTLIRNDRWGCVILYSDVYQSDKTMLGFYGFSSNDINADQYNCLNPVSSTCNQKGKPLIYSSGTTICPANYSEPSGFWNELKSLASGIWSGVTNAWDSLVNAFEDAKAAIVEEIASVIPGCGDLCKLAITKGLEAGFTALTGIPPTLPTYEGLKEDGIAYVVEVVVEAAGPDCNDTCSALIEKVVRETIAAAEASQSTPGCVDAGQAHARGKEPMCFPSDSRIKWAPAPGAVYQPAVITVEVTRKPVVVDLKNPQPLGASKEDADKYRIWISNYGFNDTRMGDWFPLCGFKEGLNGDNAVGYTDAGGGFYYKRQINDPLEGPLYKPVDIYIPWLEPGQTIHIPLAFTPELFWRTNHMYDLNQSGSPYDSFLANCGDDWPYLYYDGVSHLYAVEQCLNPEGKWVPCSGGSQDALKIQNPGAP